MGNLSVGNNVSAASASQNVSKKPSKAKVAAGVAALAGVAVLGAGLASGKIKTGDIVTFAQKAVKGALNTVKHPVKTVKSLPDKLWGLTVDGIANGTEAVLKAKNAVVDGAKLAFEYAKAIGGSVVETFSKK